MQVGCQLGILIFRIQYKNLTVVRCQIGQDVLGRIGFTGTGFTDNYHIGVDSFVITAEEIQKYRNPVTAAELDTSLIGNIGKYPGIGCRKGIAGNASSLFCHRVKRADLGADKCLHLCKFHVVQPEAMLLIKPAHHFFHAGNIGA